MKEKLEGATSCPTEPLVTNDKQIENYAKGLVISGVVVFCIGAGGRLLGYNSPMETLAELSTISVGGSICLGGLFPHLGNSRR